MLVRTDVRAVVEREIRDLLVESLGEDLDVTPDRQLHELGINSLMLARLIIQLEAALGVDPFAEEHASITDARSVGDLVAVYGRELSVVASGVRNGVPLATGEPRAPVLDRVPAEPFPA